MKRLLALLLCFCLLISGIPIPSFASDFEGNADMQTASDAEITEYETPIAALNEDAVETPSEPTAEGENEEAEVPENAEGSEENEESEAPEDSAEPEETEADALQAAIDSVLNGECDWDCVLLVLQKEALWAEDEAAALYASISAFLAQTVRDLAAEQSLEEAARSSTEEALERIKVLLEAHPNLTSETLQRDIADLEMRLLDAKVQALYDSLSAVTEMDILRMDEADYAAYRQQLADFSAMAARLDEARQEALVFPTLDFRGYGFTISEGTAEGSVLITAEVDGKTVSLVPGRQPTVEGTMETELTEDFLLRSSEDYLTFGPMMDEGFGTSQREDDASRLWLFCQNADGHTEGWLNGFTLLNDVSEIADGEACLIALVCYDTDGQGWLNLVLPNGQTVKLKEIPLCLPVTLDEPANFTMPGANAEISVDWDATVSYVEKSIILAPDKKEAPADGSLYTDNSFMCSVELKTGEESIASASFPVPAAGLWNKSQYTTPVSLEDCLFNVTRNASADTYTVESVAIPGQYLVINGGSLDAHAHPFGNTPAQITITPNESQYTLSSGKYGTYGSLDAFLWHIGSWNVFSNDAYVNNDYYARNAAKKGNLFCLFKKEGDAYFRVSGVPEDGQYLIAAQTGGSAPWLLLHPTTGSGNNDSAAAFITAVRDSSNVPTSWSYGYMTAHYTTIQFTGLRPGTAVLKPDGVTERYTVTVSNALNPNTLPSITTNLSGSQQLYTVVNGEVRTNISGQFSQSQIQYAAEGGLDGQVSAKVIQNIGSTVVYGNTWYASAGTYTGTAIPLTDCLYTFSGSKNEYTISADVNGTTVRLCTNHGLINTTEAGETFTIEPCTVDGLTYFTLTGSVTPDDKPAPRKLYYWGWKMFTNQYDSDQGSKRNYGTSRFLLYAPTNGDAGSEELPGFSRVSSITPGEKYLIAAVYENQMCIVRPSTGTGNNDHAVIRSNKCTVASTEVAFTGIHAGEARVTFGDNTAVTVTVLSSDGVIHDCFYSKTGSANGSPVQYLTISSGMEYELDLQDGSTAENQIWFSSNSQFASVDQNGLITFSEPEYLANQEPRSILIYCYNKEEHQLYALDVTVLKNDYGTTSEDINVLDHYIAQIDNAELYLGIPMYGSDQFDETNFRRLNCYEVMYLRRSNAKPWALNYFVKPNDNHAVTYLHANNSALDFFKLNNYKPELTEYYTGIPGKGNPVSTQITAYTVGNITGDTVVKNMIQKALDYGCVAAFGFTRTMAVRGDKPSCAIYVHADPLPTITKTVEYVLQSDSDFNSFKAAIANGTVGSTEWRAYQPGMDVSNSQYVIYKIHVDSNASIQNGVQYSEILLKELDNFPFLIPGETQDNMEQATFSATAEEATQWNILGALNSDNHSGDFYAYHKLSQDDVTNFAEGVEIVNVVAMSCRFTTRFQGSTVLQADSHARAALQFTISSHIQYVNLTLDDGIRANVYFDQTAPWGKQHSTYFVILEMGGKMELHPFSNTANQWELFNSSSSLVSTCSRYSISLGIQQLTEPISVHIEDEYGTRLTNDWVFTVQKYAQKAYTDPSPAITQWKRTGDTQTAWQNGENLKELMKTLMNFGAYTQIWMAGNDTVEPLANKGLPEGEKTVSLTSLPNNWSLQTLVTTHYVGGGNVSSNGIEFIGIGLEIYDSTMGLRVYFTSTPALDLQKIVGVSQHIDTVSGSYYQFTNAIPIQKDNKLNTYYVSIPDVTAKLLGNNYRISISRYNETSGTYSEADYIDVSALSYAYLLAEKLNGNAESSIAPELRRLRDMAAAMYAYSAAARIYFRTNRYINSSQTA